MLTLSVLVFLPLSSCTVPIKDNRFYADAGPDGAFWFQSLSDDHGKLSKTDWDKQRFGMICEKTDVFANLKESIDTLCQNSNSCTYEQKQAVSKFYSKVQKGGH